MGGKRGTLAEKHGRTYEGRDETGRLESQQHEVRASRSCERQAKSARETLAGYSNTRPIAGVGVTRHRPTLGVHGSSRGNAFIRAAEALRPEARSAGTVPGVTVDTTWRRKHRDWMRLGSAIHRRSERRARIPEIHLNRSGFCPGR